MHYMSLGQCFSYTFLSINVFGHKIDVNEFYLLPSKMLDKIIFDVMRDSKLEVIIYSSITSCEAS